MVPIAYVGVIALELFGAVVALIGVVAEKKAAVFTVAVLGAVGSPPLFLLELPAAGTIFLLIGIAPLFGLFAWSSQKRGGNIYGVMVGRTMIGRVRGCFFGAPILFLP